MDSSEIKQLQILAAKARLGAILGTYHAKSGHPGGSLSAADIFAYLYEKEMNIDPKNPKWADRDRCHSPSARRRPSDRVGSEAEHCIHDRTGCDGV